MNLLKLTAVALFTVAFSMTSLPGQQARPAPYGTSINLEQAKAVMAAAEAEARQNNWNVVIAILDAGGHLVMLQRMDETQFGSVEVAREKAYSAVAFRRPTKAFEDAVTGSPAGVRLLALPGASPIEGGLPIVVDGKIIGGIGVSGVTSQQDGQIAQAGLNALR